VSIDPTPLTRRKVAADDELAELEDVLQGRLEDTGIIDVHVEHRGANGEVRLGGKDDEDASPIERVLLEIAETYARNDTYAVSIELDGGSWLNFAVPVAASGAVWSREATAAAALVLVLVMASSLWALRRLTAPYAVLASAAERLGRDLKAPPLPESGPSEIRRASHAFNLMQERLQRVLSDRDQLAAAISHDLRTPVTRLRLRAEFIDDPEQRGRMLADLDEIEAMTKSLLAFVADTAREVPREQIDLVSLLSTLCDDLPSAHQTFDPNLPSRVACSAEPLALKRAVANLLDNAVRYGGCAEVSLVLDGEAARIVVEDRGPGIPEHEREAVFRPFRRLEGSRNRETGGTGLGLTIARSVARAHGGDVVLSDRPGGGLRSELILPLPAGSAPSQAFAGSAPAPAYRPPSRRGGAARYWGRLLGSRRPSA
jgi:signal transduction histidine kinase